MKHKNGYFYSLRCIKTQKTIYVGFTNRPLGVRLSAHKQEAKTKIGYLAEVIRGCNYDIEIVYIQDFAGSSQQLKTQLQLLIERVERGVSVGNMLTAVRGKHGGKPPTPIPSLQDHFTPQQLDLGLYCGYTVTHAGCGEVSALLAEYFPDRKHTVRKIKLTGGGSGIWVVRTK